VSPPFLLGQKARKNTDEEGKDHLQTESRVSFHPLSNTWNALLGIPVQCRCLYHSVSIFVILEMNYSILRAESTYLFFCDREMTRLALTRQPMS
jgi:hypothetical protein